MLQKTLIRNRWLLVKWSPRWPAFAVGFYKGAGEIKYRYFTIVLWSLVIEFSTKGASDD